jgi:VanZ family protein
MTAEGSVSEQALRTAILWMLALTVLFMIYASLYPFEFDFSRFATLEQRDWMRSLSWRRPARTDLIANLLFYLPFGALVTVLTPQRWGVLLRALFVLGCGLLLSLLIEAAQVATRTRDPSITDVIMNGSSAGLAAILALCARGLGLRPSLPELRAPRPDVVALLLIALWLTFHAVPFMPSPRFVFVFRAPLRMIDVHWSSAAFAGFFAGYLLLAAALRHLLRPTSFWPVFLLCAAGSILSRLLFRNHQLQLNECAGLLLALPLIWRMKNAGAQDACRSAAFWAAPAFVFFTLARAGAVRAGLLLHRRGVGAERGRPESGARDPDDARVHVVGRGGASVAGDQGCAARSAGRGAPRRCADRPAQLAGRDLPGR